MVSLHRAGGDKRLSTSRTRFHASSRRLLQMDPDYDSVWETFKQIVGKEIKVVTYHIRIRTIFFHAASTNKQTVPE